MKRYFTILLASGLAVSAVHAQPTNNAPKTDFSKTFKSDQEKYSYALGMWWAASFKAQMQSRDVEYDPEVMSKAFNNAIMGVPTLVTDEQEHEILNELSKEISLKRGEKHKKHIDELQAKGQKNLVDTPAFLEANKTKPGVMTLPSGLQYKILTDGTGTMPSADDEVTLSYDAKLADGTEFDSVKMRGGPPMVVPVQRLPLKGLSEAVQLMKTGSKWELYIPPALGYGTNFNDKVPPNSVVIYDVELLATKAPPAAAKNAQPIAAPLTSDIIKVPSAEEMKKGAKIETIKPEDLEKEKAKAATNSTP